MIWLLLFLSATCAFLIAGIESALLTVNRVRVRHAAEAGDTRAARLSKLLEQRALLLQAASALHHFTSLLAHGLLVFLVFHQAGFTAWLALVLLIVPMSLFLLELLPAQLFKLHPVALLRRALALLELLYAIAKPWGKIMKRLTRGLVAIAPPEHASSGLAHVARSIITRHLLPVGGQGLLQGLSDFHQLRALDLMLPLRHLTALPPEMPLVQVMVLTREQKHPWRAVLADNGTLLGWLDALSLPAVPIHDRVVRQYLRPLGQARSTDTALRCLQMLRKRGEPILSVVNEEGEVLGVITQESMQKALFGSKTVS